MIFSLLKHLHIILGDRCRPKSQESILPGMDLNRFAMRLPVSGTVSQMKYEKPILTKLSRDCSRYGKDLCATVPPAVLSLILKVLKVIMFIESLAMQF